MVHSLSLGLAFGAGLLSFVSPCTLPLFPSYLGYISGVSFQDLMGAQTRLSPRIRWRALSHALLFSLGLSFLFVLLGFGATAVGRLLEDYKVTIRLLGGALVLVMGLFMAGVIKSEWLLQERRPRMPAQKPLGYLGSFLVGVAFAAGWTPCIGPILASVLMMIAAHPGLGTWYMVAYAAGFALPFMILALTLTSIRPLLKYTGMIAKVGGWLLVLMGLLLITDRMTVITVWIQNLTGFNGLGV